MLGLSVQKTPFLEGYPKNRSSSTLKDSAYAFIFNQQELMASLSIEGTKISHIKR